MVLAWIGYANLKPVDTTDYLQVKCEAGSDLKLKPIACERADQPGALLRFTVNRSANTVFMDVIENNSQFLGAWFFLDRCKVASFDNWKCGDTSTGQKIDSEYGVIDGRYYQSTTGGNSLNFYTASLHGLPMYAYRYGLVSLKTAIEWD